MYHLALCAIRWYIYMRTWAVCAHTMCAASYTYIHVCARARISYLSRSLIVHSSRCARAPLAFACLARKSRVHALLRARVCQVCVYRVPQRIATGRERERDTRHFVSRDDTRSRNLLVIPFALETTAVRRERRDRGEDSSDTGLRIVRE